MSKFINSLLAGLCISLAGCGTSNTNPASARAHTGYVDFYTDAPLDLSWEVKRGEESGGEMRTVYLEYEPLAASVLRLEAPPGEYRFQIWFTNLATDGPQVVHVKVEDGKITPVHVRLEAAGTAEVDRKVYAFRPSAKGFGRGTKVVTDASQLYRITLATEALRAYEPAERMTYYSTEPASK